MHILDSKVGCQPWVVAGDSLAAATQRFWRQIQTRMTWDWSTDVDVKQESWPGIMVTETTQVDWKLSKRIGDPTQLVDFKGGRLFAQLPCYTFCWLKNRNNVAFLTTLWHQQRRRRTATDHSWWRQAIDLSVCKHWRKFLERHDRLLDIICVCRVEKTATLSRDQTKGEQIPSAKMRLLWS